jgi:hypothetical protein
MKHGNAHGSLEGMLALTPSRLAETVSRMSKASTEMNVAARVRLALILLLFSQSADAHSFEGWLPIAGVALWVHLSPLLVLWRRIGWVGKLVYAARSLSSFLQVWPSQPISGPVFGLCTPSARHQLFLVGCTGVG